MSMRLLAIGVGFCCTVLVSAADDNPYDKVSSESRMQAVRHAQVWTHVDVSTRNLKAGPGRRGFSPGTTVRCKHFEKDSGGKTPKFWCAISPDDQVKVKYGQDNGEVYGEVAATRLLWALGFAADAMYPVRVECKGCTADPFRDKAKSSMSATFDPAVIERPAAGDVIETNKDSGWTWIDLDSVDQSRGGAPRAHRDALKLLAVFMQHSDTKAAQQRLLCLDRQRGLPARQDGSCAHPFMMLADLGKTFGKANMLNKDDPGAVNLRAWAGAEIWRDGESCIGNLNQSFTGTLDRPKISEDGRRFLSDLLEQLSDRQIRDLFEVSQFTRREPGSTIDDWVQVFKAKRDEIASRRCTNPVL